MGNLWKLQLSLRLSNSPGDHKDFSSGDIRIDNNVDEILAEYFICPSPILLHFMALMTDESNPCCDVHSVASLLKGPCLVKFHLRNAKDFNNFLDLLKDYKKVPQEIEYLHNI